MTEKTKPDTKYQNILRPDAPHQAIVRFEIGAYERDAVGRCLPPQVMNDTSHYTFHAKTFAELEVMIEKFKEVFENAKREYEASEE